MSIVIPGISLYRRSLYRGSTVLIRVVATRDCTFFLIQCIFHVLRCVTSLITTFIIALGVVFFWPFFICVFSL